MRIRRSAGLMLAGACCAGLAACTAASSSGPVNTVTTPAVGRPAAPASVEAALARMPLFPYTILGQADNDPLAPGESDTALGAKCVATAGYPSAQDMLGVAVRAGAAGLGIAQNWGPWGYLGAADAQQLGFRLGASKGLQELGLGPPGSANPGGAASLPKAEQDAINKCAAIKFNFLNAMFNGPLAGINSIAGAITSDLASDPSVKSATRAWSACMAKNGYHYATPQDAVSAQQAAMYGNGNEISASQTISPSVNSAQIAAAVSDAGCTSSTDLAGIYFAVEASYEQQVVSANQTALSTAVTEFRSAYAREIGELPHLLATTKANAFPNPPGKGKANFPGSGGTPSRCVGGPSSESAC